MTSTKWTLCAVEGSLPPTPHRRPGKAFPPRPPRKTFGERSAFQRCEQPHPHHNPCHSDARAQRDRRNLLLTFACATPPASSRAQPFFRRSEGSPANPHRARVRRTLLPPAFALLCHPERSMTPTKWTSCAVEGSLPPTPHRRPSKAFPPRMRRYGPLGGAASSAANNPTPPTTLVISTRERRETGGTCSCLSPSPLPRRHPERRRSSGGARDLPQILPPLV